MILLYRILTTLLYPVIVIIIYFRKILKKEDPIRYREKIFPKYFNVKRDKKNKLIWFHAASVGELKSILPLINELNNKNKKLEFLITTITVTSAHLAKDKFKNINNVHHRFFPIDSGFLMRKFINLWKPKIIFLVDSEIWPNLIFAAKENNILLAILNARITKKTFKKWMKFSSFSNYLFKNFDLCLSSNNESINYLRKLGAKKIKYIGNLKYAQSEHKIDKLKKSVKKFIHSKTTWCASSTHYNEEKLCGLVHKRLKIKHKNLLTIIIPRHINRIESIKKNLMELDLKVHLDKPNSTISPYTDIYLVNSYGKTKSFYNHSKNVFLGGSIINHGGQNPLEAARFGCNIIHGKNISNFREIYKYLKKNNISHLVNTNLDFEKKLDILLSKRGDTSKKIRNKINLIGKKILKNTIREINYFLKDAI